MPKRTQLRGVRWVVSGGLAVAFASAPIAQQTARPTPQSTSADASYRGLVSSYCLSCHNNNSKAGNLELDAIAGQPIAEHWDVWEKVDRKLRARQMPPPGARRPDDAERAAAVNSLEAELDKLAAAAPNPGRTDTFRRLNRTEYRNAIRDLLALDFDAASVLPSDSASYGFDNITVGNLSPTLLESYVTAAEKISRLAVGGPSLSPGGATVRLRPDLTQENHIEGLPIGTRGGALVSHTFPVDGEYEITIRLARDRNEHIEGLTESHQLDLLLDDGRLKTFTVEPAPKASPTDTRGSATGTNAADAAAPITPDNMDSHLKVRVPVQAGPHTLGVTFEAKPSLLLETARQPYQAHFNYYRHPRIQPAVYEISIVGPYNATGPGDTPSRQRIFSCHPPASASAQKEDGCAKQILSALMRRAYRRPINETDLKTPLDLYRTARTESGFESGIEMGLAAILSSPEFLFHIERDPGGVAVGAPYRISDLELASRLSFFIWSSVPDDELLDAGIRGDLGKPAVLEREVRRMLADPRSENLVNNFAEQWLHLRNLESISPDMRIFPDFDDNLRQAFRQETDLLLKSVIAEDRSVLDLLRANYTFLNERLAKHYGIPNVYGSRFRKVTFEANNARGGLLRQGSILMVTSYPTRTSPVIRGKWVLDNLLGVPPPPPLPNVPALKDAKAGAKQPQSVRARLAEHRANPVCANCHRLMDPIGFALENYDAVGRWRTVDANTPVDASGTLFDGTSVQGVAGLQKGILDHPDLFVSTLSEKLLTFGLGRGVEYYDGPSIRKVVRDAAANDYRFSSLVIGIVNSTPFRMRKSS